MSAQVDRAALAGHLEALAQAAQLVAQDLRSGLADLGDGMACVGRAGGGASGDPPVNSCSSSALLDARELSAQLGINLRTLRRWRHEGRAPKPLRGKGPLRWRRTDVERWLQERAS